MGAKTYLGADQQALIASGSGRVVNVVVGVAGSAGTLHDAASVAKADDTNIIGLIPAAAGGYTINMPFTSGLVIKPGASSVVTVSYSGG